VVSLTRERRGRGYKRGEAVKRSGDWRNASVDGKNPFHLATGGEGWLVVSRTKGSRQLN